MQQNNQPSIEQVINKMRDDMLRTQSTANTTAVLGFDNLVEQLKIFAHQINDKNNEIARLAELCRKNNIDTKPPVSEVAKAAEPPKDKQVKPGTVTPKST